MASPDVGIYGIENTVTGKWYVGSSVELSKRFSRHLWELRSGRHHSDKLQRSFDKHGVQAFEFKLLMVCAKEDLEFYESRAIKAYNGFTDGYNVAAEAKGGFMRGRNWPEATKAARIEEMKTRRMTEEQKAKISELKKAEWSTDEGRNKYCHPHKMSKEGAAKINAASLKRKTDPALAELRSAEVKKGWETRRRNKQLKNEREA